MAPETPQYLRYMKITPNLLKEAHIQPVGEYLNGMKDKENLLTLMEGENAFLIFGELETAATKLQKVYDSIPADSAPTAKEHAHLILIEVKRCQRHSQR